jgi:hypothetical protein
VQGTGGLGEPPLQEVAYGWKLPDGWIPQDGSLPYNSDEKAYYTYVNAIDIIPTGCSLSGGNVMVWGSIKNQCIQAGYTQSASITLSGTQPSITFGPQAGFTGTTFCNKTPVTFTATVSPTLQCISGYTWVFPASWSWKNPATNQYQPGPTPVTLTTNTISLTPSGSSADAAAINVTANFACGTSILSSNYIPPYNDPKISGPDLICSNTANYTLLYSPGLSVQWFSNNPTGIAINISTGLASRQNNFNGQASIYAKATGSCGVYQTLPFKLHVGQPTFKFRYDGQVPASTDGTIPQSYTATPPNHTLIADAFTSGSKPGHANFVLTIVNQPTDVKNVYTDDSTFVFSDKGILGSFTIRVSASNTCAPSGINGGLIYFCNTNCSAAAATPVRAASIAIFPNPAKSTISLTVTDSLNTNQNLDQNYEVVIYDRFSRKVFSTVSTRKTLEIGISNLPPDIYYVSVRYKEAILQEQIIVAH